MKNIMNYNLFDFKIYIMNYITLEVTVENINVYKDVQVELEFLKI
jgi:hypothetical protein